jgi:hypothetical protein
MENYNKEDQEILLKDLFPRLVYGVFVKEDNGSDVIYTRYYHPNIEKCKPYLRPISSLTEKECDKLFEILEIVPDASDKNEWLKINDIGIIRLFTEEGKDFEDIIKAIEYLYSINVDFRGLIEKGLAITAPENLYNKES